MPKTEPGTTHFGPTYTVHFHDSDHPLDSLNARAHKTEETAIRSAKLWLRRHRGKVSVVVMYDVPGTANPVVWQSKVVWQGTS